MTTRIMFQLNSNFGQVQIRLFWTIEGQGNRLQIIKINRKKFGGSGITPSYFPALMNMAIFHNTEPKKDFGHSQNLS